MLAYLEHDCCVELSKLIATDCFLDTPSRAPLKTEVSNTFGHSKVQIEASYLVGYILFLIVLVWGFQRNKPNRR